MRFVLFIFILGSFSANAQLNGAYIRDGEVYSFHNNGSFDWIKTGSGISYGNGSYKLNGKKLELTFTKARLQFDVQLNESKPVNGDKSIIEVRIMYSNGQPTPQTKFTLILSQITQYLSDQGILKLELSKPLAEDSFMIDFGGRISSPLKIKLKGYDTLLGIVVDETAEYKENVTETFTLKQKRGKILLNGKSFGKSRTL
jgi:hypothetical protein